MIKRATLSYVLACMAWLCAGQTLAQGAQAQDPAPPPAISQIAPVRVAPGTPLASVASPDGRLQVDMRLDNDGRIEYAVKRDGKALITPSRMGFLLSDSYNLVRNFAFVDAQVSPVVSSTWELPWGERRFVQDTHTQLFVRFRQRDANARVIGVRFRLFNDGFGFRYEIPDQPNLQVMNIADELTEFNFAQNGTAWWIPGNEWNRQEYLYEKTAIDAVSLVQTPITFRLRDGTHISMHEAALVDYSAMRIKRVTGTKFRSDLAASSKGPRVIRNTPFNTPWRTLRITDTAAQLVESDLELNLNEPNKLGDVSWVKPFNYIGIWWEMHLDKSTWSTGPRHGATTQNALRHIDFAAKHGFRGVLIEGWNVGWDGDWFGRGADFSFTKPTPDFDLRKVAAYAREKGVHIVGHHETGGNIAVYEPQLEDAMKLYAELGIDAVKTGYVADENGIIAPGDKPGSIAIEYHDGQVMARHHLKVVEVAAKYKIAVNPHEPIKDTGLRRTYPNWVSREGDRGMEYNAWGNPDNGPDHEPTLVYTRMLSGPMDFTPGVLSLAGKNNNFMASTLAKQLGLYVVLYSPIQMVADLPENLEKYPAELAFIAKIPTDWQKSKLIAGEIGDYAVFARQDRNSNDWFVGGVNDATARTVVVNFDYLEDRRTYTATIFRDGPGADFRTDKRHAIINQTRMVKKGDKMSIRMAPAGGFAIRLQPVG